MWNIFGSRQTPEQLQEACIDTLKDGSRTLDREMQNLAREEKATKIKLKAEAKKGRTPMATAMIRNIVRMQNTQAMFYRMQAQLSDIQAQIRLMKSVATMQNCMKGAARSMYRLNQQVSMPAMQELLTEFQKQSGVMDMKSEMMQEAIDDAMKQDGDEEKEEEMMQRVLDEVGIQFAEQVKAPPKASPRANPNAAATEASQKDDDEIDERFRAFKESVVGKDE